MTIPELIQAITRDEVALFFFFMTVPLVAFLVSMSLNGFRDRANQPPYSYIYATLVYVSAVPGVISFTFWIYSIIFEKKGLLGLNFSVYYLPGISMLLVLLIVSRQVNMKRLPWFGELYELLAMIAVVSGFVLLIIHNRIINFEHWWQVFLLFILFFGLLKLGWERLMRLTR